MVLRPTRPRTLAVVGPGVVLVVLGAVAAVVVGIPFFLLGYGLPGPAGGERRDDTGPAAGGTATDPD